MNEGTHPGRGWLGKAVLYALLAVALGYWVIVAAFSVQLLPLHGSDFGIYYAAAEVLRYTPAADLYAWEPLAAVTRAHGGCALWPHVLYVYPPLLALLLVPLTALPCGAATVTWHLVNVGLWALATVLLVEWVRRRWAQEHTLLATALVVAASAFSWPLLYGFWLGQVHVLVLAGMIAALWLDDRGHPMLAGILLALVALLKLFPALLVVYYLLRGRWRIVAGATLGAAALVGLMLAVVSPDEVLRSVQAMRAAVATQINPGLNESLATLLPFGGAALSVLVGMCWLAGLLWLRGRGNSALGFAWTLCTMLLVSPLIWSFYWAWLVPAFALCLGALRPSRDRWWIAVLVVVVIPFSFPLPMLLRPLAALALWGICGWLLLRSAARTVTPRMSDEHAVESIAVSSGLPTGMRGAHPA